MAVSGWRLGRCKRQGETGNRIGCCGARYGWRVAATGGGWQARDLYLNLIPDGRDLGPENGFPATCHLGLPPATREWKH